MIAGDETNGSRRYRDIRNSPCRRCSRASASRATPSNSWRNRAVASGSFPRRCGRRLRPICGGKTPPIRHSPRTPTPRCATLTLIEAANAEEEALAIAVALREAVHDGKTAALVTPDRALGRRVLAALGALGHRGRGFRRRCARRHAGRDFRAACGRCRARRPRPGDAARFAQASAAAPRRERPGARRRHFRARDPARATSASRQRRSCARAESLSRPARKIPAPRGGRSASLRSAHRADRHRACRRRGISLPGSPMRWRRSKASARRRFRSAILLLAIAPCWPRCRGKTARR